MVGSGYRTRRPKKFEKRTCYHMLMQKDLRTRVGNPYHQYEQNGVSHREMAAG